MQDSIRRQSASAASAMTAQRAFSFGVYAGEPNGELFVGSLENRMHRRRKPEHRISDSLPAHNRAIVGEYMASAVGQLTLHFLPGHAPELNPDEMVWSHVKRAPAPGPL